MPNKQKGGCVFGAEPSILSVRRTLDEGAPAFVAQGNDANVEMIQSLFKVMLKVVPDKRELMDKINKCE
jgi:hypothetical protein